MRPAVLCVGLLIAAPALAQSASFEGTGEAPVAAGDWVRARARALDEALRQVIDAAAASLLDAAALAERQSALKLTVEPKARSYLAGYRIVDEAEAGGVFRVRVAAEVLLDGLERDLRAGGAGTDAASAPLPRIGVCIAPAAAATASLGGAPPADAPASASADGPASYGPPPSAAALEAALLAAGAVPAPLPLACAGADDGPAPPSLQKALSSARLDAALTARFAARGAGPIRGTSLVGVHVDLHLALVDAAGAHVWTAEVPADGHGPDLGAATLATLAAAQGAALGGVAEAVARRWPRAPAILVRVRFERYADLAALERALAAVAGVTRVEPRRFSSGTAELLVEAAGTATALAAAASRPPASASSPRFVARAADARTVDVDVLPPPLPSTPAPGVEPPIRGPVAVPAGRPPGAAMSARLHRPPAAPPSCRG